MRKLIVQYNTHNGPYADKSHKIVFDVDETQKNGVLDLAKECDRGTELLLFVCKTSSDEGKEIMSETPEQTRARFFKMMYAMIHSAAKENNKTPEEIKTLLKKYLVEKKYIVKSSSELTLEGLGVAIFYLKTEFLKNTTEEYFD